MLYHGSFAQISFGSAWNSRLRYVYFCNCSSGEKSKPVLVVVLMALTLSAVLECIPVIKNALGSAWIIIICAVATSLIGAVLFPVEDKEEEE